MASQLVDLFVQVEQFYRGTQAVIEAVPSVEEGSIGYATDINKFGVFNGTTWDWIDPSAGGGFTQEQIEDFVGAMFSGNTETGIAATYDDPTGKINLVAEVTQAELDAVPQAPNLTRYNFDSSTTAADPGTGDLRFNSATQASVTQLYISQTSALGGDITRILEASGLGDVWYVQDADDATKWIRFTQNAAGTDNGAWWTIPVTYVGHAGSLFLNNTELAVTLNMSPNPATILDTEGLQDLVGAMVSSNTETGIDVTYDDAGGKLNFDAQTPGDARYRKIPTTVTSLSPTTADITLTITNQGADNIFEVDLSGLTATRYLKLPAANLGTMLTIIITADSPSTSYNLGVQPISGTSSLHGSMGGSWDKTLHYDKDVARFQCGSSNDWEAIGDFFPDLMKIWRPMRFHPGNKTNPTWSSTPLNDYAISYVDYLQPELNGAVNVELTGLDNGGYDLRLFVLSNYKTSLHDIILKHESASSSASNRFTLPGSNDLRLVPGQGVLLMYDTNGSRWKLLGSVGHNLQGMIVDPALTTIASPTNKILRYDGSKLTLSTVKYSDVYGGNGNSLTVAASPATGQLAFWLTGILSSGGNTPMPKAGTLKNLRVRIITNQPASGSLVFDVMINNVASAITITLAAGGGAGTTISDTTHSATISAGDLVYVRITNNASAASAQISNFNIELEQEVA